MEVVEGLAERATAGMAGRPWTDMRWITRLPSSWRSAWGVLTKSRYPPTARATTTATRTRRNAFVCTAAQ